jgi:agmatine deiminase
MIRLPAEWEPQDAVLLTWPHKNTDWQRLLERAITTYFALLEQLLDYVPVIIAVSPELVSELCAEVDKKFSKKRYTAHLFSVPCNDTWTRDHGPITVELDDGLQVQDFIFNGWGNKFAVDFDNDITAKLTHLGAFGGTPVNTVPVVLEGGAIESDGAGTLLTTSQCLLNPNRNPHMNKGDIERALRETLGVKRVLWLDHGYLVGDDTDSHIDTLARMAPEDTITYVKCDDVSDEHFAELSAMEAELQQFRTLHNCAYHLIPLPWPQAKYCEDGHRLPATYANYLVTNGAVLVPIYNDVKDGEAMAQIGKAFPGRDIVGVDCLALIEQHGSLHCVTMQLPRGSLDLGNT